jgi:hypothetical protein
MQALVELAALPWGAEKRRVRFPDGEEIGLIIGELGLLLG